MSPPRSRLGPMLAAFALTLMATLAAAQQPQPRSRSRPGADPEINRKFAHDDVNATIARLEAEDREVYARREAIVASLGLKPGMAVADIGAGTGLFVRRIADRVGPEGTVYAVEVAAPLARHIAAQAKKAGQAQVKAVLANQDSTGLPAGSIDLAFLCDVYHHLEHPQRTLASIHRALRPGGQLVVVELDRTKAKEGSFAKTHVRADPSVFDAEIRSAGFEPRPLPDPPALKENVVLHYRKAAGAKAEAPR